jgi:hypothetical protein
MKSLPAEAGNYRTSRKASAVQGARANLFFAPQLRPHSHRPTASPLYLWILRIESQDPVVERRK